MILVLIKKDLMLLRGYIAFIFAMLIVGYGAELMMLYPHELSPFKEDMMELIYISGIANFILIYFMSNHLFKQEFDGKTMEYLDTLPITRSAVFFTKILLLWLIIVSVELIDSVIVMTFQTMSLDSLSSSFYWDFNTKLVLIDCFAYFVMITFCVLFSYLRRFSVLIILMVFIGFFTLEKVYPDIALLNFFSLFELHFYGQQLLFPESLMMVQIGLALTCLLFAWLLFCSRLVESLKNWKLKKSTAIKFFIGLSVFSLSIFLLYTAITKLTPKTNTQDYDAEQGSFDDFTTMNAYTKFYVFVYNKNQHQQIQPLLAQADDIYLAVSTFFDSTLDHPITVDITTNSNHYAGSAYWKKIRMDSNQIEDGFQSTLGHETAHIFISVLSDQHASKYFNALRVLHEGLANYVEYHLFRDTDALQRLRSLSALASSKEKQWFDVLIDNETFTQKWDGGLVYPLGERLFASIIAKHGKQSVLNFIQALDSEENIKDLSAYELWTYLMNQSGLSLSRSVNQFSTDLQQDEKKYADFIQQFPTLKGRVDLTDEQLSLYPEGNAPAGWRVVCRLRDSDDASLADYYSLYFDEEGGYFSDHYVEHGAWYQLGFVEIEGGRSVYQQWVKIP